MEVVVLDGYRCGYGGRHVKFPCICHTKFKMSEVAFWHKLKELGYNIATVLDITPVMRQRVLLIMGNYI